MRCFEISGPSEKGEQGLEQSCYRKNGPGRARKHRHHRLRVMSVGATVNDWFSHILVKANTLSPINMAASFCPLL